MRFLFHYDFIVCNKIQTIQANKMFKLKRIKCPFFRRRTPTLLRSGDTLFIFTDMQLFRFQFSMYEIDENGLKNTKTILQHHSTSVKSLDFNWIPPFRFEFIDFHSKISLPYLPFRPRLSLGHPENNKMDGEMFPVGYLDVLSIRKMILVRQYQCHYLRNKHIKNTNK